MTIRPMQEGDIPQIAAIEKLCFADPWSEAALMRELHENAAMAHYLVIAEDDRILGYGGYWQVFDEANICNIAVAPDNQGRGLGYQLMQALIAEFPARGVMYATLEVRASNERAIRLYRKCGFAEVGIRKDFYSHPREDGILMAYKR